ncbi:hypothetical protein SPPR111872_15405 [Sphingobacterium prati]
MSDSVVPFFVNLIIRVYSRIQEFRKEGQLIADSNICKNKFLVMQKPLSNTAALFFI